MPRGIAGLATSTPSGPCGSVGTVGTLPYDWIEPSWHGPRWGEIVLIDRSLDPPARSLSMTEFLTQSFYGNTILQWAIAATIAVLSVAGGRTVYLSLIHI